MYMYMYAWRPTGSRGSQLAPCDNMANGATGVCTKKLLLRRKSFGRLALRAPNQWLESSFGRRFAGQRLVRKEY